MAKMPPEFRKFAGTSKPMADTSTIYLSYHENDNAVVKALVRHLNTLFPEGRVRYTDRNSEAPDALTVENTQKRIEAADVVLLFGSASYFNKKETLLERDYAKRSPRAPLIVPLLAKSVPAFPGLEEYAVLPSDGIPLANDNVLNDIQCTLAARTIFNRVMLFADSYRPIPTAVRQILDWEMGRARLYSYLAKNNLRAGLQLMRRLVKDPDLDKIVFEAIEEHQRLHRRTQQERLEFKEFWRQLKVLRSDMEHLVARLQAHNLRPDWQDVLEREYFAFQTIEAPELDWLGLSTLADDIAIPETRLQSADTSEDLLTDAQKLEFKRLFILAQDAEAVGNHSKAYGFCEQIKNNIDAESAQLYEHLLLTYVQWETPDRIVREALQGQKRRLDFVILYAGRFQEYQQKNKCASETGYYNVAEVAAELVNALRRAYAALPNDYMIDTGLNAERYPDQRPQVLRCLDVALDIYNYLHPAEGFLELVFNELCGGGKYQWADFVSVREGQFSVINRNEFDLLSEIANVQKMLLDPEVRNADDPVEQAKHRRVAHYNQRQVLRENLLLCLYRKRAALRAAIQEERRFFREFIDERASLIRFTYTCIIGYLVLDEDEKPDKSDFLNLALDELLRQPEVPWFTLGDNGQLIQHPEIERYAFPAFEIVEKIIHTHAGEAGWLQVHPQVKAEIFRKYAADTDAEYQRIVEGMQWTDFRRLDEIGARQRLIQCLRNWMVCYRAYPEQGQDFLVKCLHELTGTGLLIWMYFNPEKITTHPDSQALGFNAVAELAVLQTMAHWTPDEVAMRVVESLYQKRILPAYNALPKGDENHRIDVISLLLQTLQAYKNHPNNAHLEWVYRELTDEVKFNWIVISDQGEWLPASFQTAWGFDPVEVLKQLALLDETRFGQYNTRKKLADKRFAALQAEYLREISEYRHENRLPERELAIRIFRNIKGIFKFFPDRKYLELPIRELSGNGRIRWQANFMGIFEVPENHHENLLLNFDYKSERLEFRMYWDTCAQWQEKMLSTLR